MANPNMINVANVTGMTALLSTNSTYANLVVNASGSNTIVKINTITITNSSNANFLANVDIYRSSTSYPIVGNVVVPANSVGTGSVAGLGVGPQGEPGVNKKKKLTPFLSFIRRKKPQ